MLKSNVSEDESKLEWSCVRLLSTCILPVLNY